MFASVSFPCPRKREKIPSSFDVSDSNTPCPPGRWEIGVGSWERPTPSAISHLLSPTNTDIMRVFFAVCQARATGALVSALSGPQRPNRRRVVWLAKNRRARDEDISTGLADRAGIGGIDTAIDFNGHVQTTGGDLLLESADLVQG